MRLRINDSDRKWLSNQLDAMVQGVSARHDGESVRPDEVYDEILAEIARRWSASARVGYPRERGNVSAG